MARVVVDVMLKPEILDPQGKAVHGAFGRLGFGGVEDVRQGKRFEITLDGEVTDERVAEIRKAAETLLANPVIEDFAIHIAPDPTPEPAQATDKATAAADDATDDDDASDGSTQAADEASGPADEADATDQSTDATDEAIDAATDTAGADANDKADGTGDAGPIAEGTSNAGEEDDATGRPEDSEDSDGAGGGERGEGA